MLSFHGALEGHPDMHRMPFKFTMDILDTLLLVKDTPLPSGKKSEVLKSAFTSRSGGKI